MLMYIDAYQAQALSQFATGRGPSILKLGYQYCKSLNLLFACSTKEDIMQGMMQKHEQLLVS